MRAELRCGFNKQEKKYYVEIVDVDTQDNMRVYLDGPEFVDFGNSMVAFVSESRKREMR